MKEFYSAYNLEQAMGVLDVGGDFFNWSFFSAGHSLTIVNLYFPEKNQWNVSWVIADGRYLPFQKGAFDVVYSNSVIEHVENFKNQNLFASECRRVGVGYYVQTPNKRFPIEPHLITPFIHWLPRDVQKRLLRYFTVWGLVAKPSRQERDQFMNTTRLLSEKELRELFPEAEIWYERVVGLKKSLMAVRLPG